MAKLYDAVFTPVLPRLRQREEILRDFDDGGNGRTTEASRAAVVQIELLIREGEDFYRRGEYQAAVDRFRQARAEIFRLLHPSFDVRAFLSGRKLLSLPVAVDLEKNLQELSIRIATAVKPQTLPTAPFFGNGAPVPSALSPFLATGFHEAATIEEAVQGASAQGVSLLLEGNAAAAADVMSRALAEARESQTELDPALVGALELNLAVAQLQAGEPEQAEAHAEAAAEHFRDADDDVGEAQALHVNAVRAVRTGDQRAPELFAAAAELLKGRERPVGPRLPGGPGDREREPVTRPPAPGGHTGTLPTLERSTIPATRLRPGPRLGEIALGPLLTKDVAALRAIADREASTLTVRVAGRTDGWTAIPAADKREQAVQAKSWKVGVPVGDDVVSLVVGGRQASGADAVAEALFRRRVIEERVSGLHWAIVDPSTTTFYLSHLYAYVLPVKIGDAYHELGQYALAEEHYLQAAAYSFLNKQLEGTALWVKIAANALEWGNTLYREERLDDAKAQYLKIVTADGSVPTSPLYTLEALDVPAGEARTLLGGLTTRPLPEVNWEISGVILSAGAMLRQLLAGLDYYGLLLSPIHTFEYLQGIARGFAQEAIQAEREFVNFKSREELEAATRRDLETTIAMAQAEAEARRQQYIAAQEDESAAQNALNLARKRRDDAQAQRDRYASVSWTQIWSQAAAAAQAAGSDSWWSEISELADKLDRGESIHGERGKLAAAYTLQAGRKNREYELKKMDDNIAELTQAITVAQDQLDGARARTAASEIAWQAAVQRVGLAQSSLAAFDAEFFTPETWGKMAGIMRSISRSYLFRAIRIAKLMERAFNFENDADLHVIRNEYGHAVANRVPESAASLLGGDSLLQDVDSFTYQAITTKSRKSSRIKDVISIAADFPAQFADFRRTGLLAFETDVYEFDRLHPGFYAQRIEAVELEIVGLIAETGVHGTLTAGGVTKFRKRDGSLGTRTHVVDTMALSEFTLRNDVFLYQAETGVRGLFQGIGVGSTWQLHLPRRSNDYDLNRIFDVHLVLYYTAQFDATLRDSVLAAPLREGELVRVKDFALRYDFPDAWYAFYRAGNAHFTLDRVRLPLNQTSFTTESASFRVVTKPGVSSEGIELRITAPGGASATETTDAEGTVSSVDGPLAAIAGGDPIGAWEIEVVGGAPLENGDDGLALERISNIQLGLEYAFEYVPEAT